MNRKSDLAIENFGFAMPQHGKAPTLDTLCGFPLFSAETDTGQYQTLIAEKIWLDSEARRRQLTKALSQILKKEIGDRKRILFVGLGNASLPSDALGPKTAARIPATGEAGAPLPSLFVLTPGISAHTGIDTADHIRCLADHLKPQLILLTDALSAKSKERLCTVVQITSCGLAPGSALSPFQQEISSRTMPCPVLSMGVPTVIGSPQLSGQADEDPVFVTRADCDIVTDCYASLLASAVNRAIFG